MADRIVFFGTGDFAVPIFKSLYQHYFISALITQPDKEQGRGKIKKISPIKQAAIEAKIPVIQPEKLSEDNFRNQLQNIEPDLIIVAAYGKIIPKWILDLSKLKCINVHASLLPRWRGASPIQKAILEGDKKTGITIMLMDEGLDTGPIITQKTIIIEPKDTALTLTSRLSQAGAELLLETLPIYEKGEIKPRAQNETEATYCGLISKHDGLLDFNRPAISLERQIRAFNPWPICYMNLDDQKLRIYLAQLSQTNEFKISQRGIIDKMPAVGTAENDLILVNVQLPGKKIISGREFLNGYKKWQN